MQYLSLVERSKHIFLVCVFCFFAQAINAAPPYATVVMDARNGDVVYSKSADKVLHPASLTKMMTLYIAFSEIQAGRLGLDEVVTVSKKAASEPPSKINLKTGQKIKVRYLIRAIAIKSANDASTALAEHIAGSEAAFTQYMTATAARLGMRNSRFKNAHGLTAVGHQSTAMDMAVLGRRLIYDHPKFFNLFGREYAELPRGNYRNSNIRFLRDYPGADGIKTGYTSAAGYNLVGSAQRGKRRVIVAMFGGQSSYQRNQQVGALMDLGFKRIKQNVKVARLPRVNMPGFSGVKNTAVASVTPQKPPSPSPSKPVASVSTLTAAPKRPANLRTFAMPSSSTAIANVEPPKVIDSGVANSGYTLEMAPPRSITELVAEVNAATVIENNNNTNANTGKYIQVYARPNDLFRDNSNASASVIDSSQNASVEASQSIGVTSGDYAIHLEAQNSRKLAEDMISNTSSTITELNNSNVKSQIIVVSMNGETLYRPRYSGISEESAYDICSGLQNRGKKCFIIASN